MRQVWRAMVRGCIFSATSIILLSRVGAGDEKREVKAVVSPRVRIGNYRYHLRANTEKAQIELIGQVKGAEAGDQGEVRSVVSVSKHLGDGVVEQIVASPWGDNGEALFAMVKCKRDQRREFFGFYFTHSLENGLAPVETPTIAKMYSSDENFKIMSVDGVQRGVQTTVLLGAVKYEEGFEVVNSGAILLVPCPSPTDDEGVTIIEWKGVTRPPKLPF
ncbi:hypothetical protein [Schlesneria sp. T3-172]|uniref:hypothetical protein n=1 Tax=Schlesneria sphaerica TaxID=3373610 RepID=UPI0037CC61EE